MPIIKLNNGKPPKRVSYGSAAKLNEYLTDPDKLKEITDPEARAKKEEFLMTVESIDWSDLTRSKTEPTKANRPEVQRVMNDKTLKGKAKFDAMRIALGATRPSKFDDQ